MDSTEEVHVGLSAKELEIADESDVAVDGGVLDPPKSILKKSAVTQGEEDDQESSENAEKNKDK